MPVLRTRGRPGSWPLFKRPKHPYRMGPPHYRPVDGARAGVLPLPLRRVPACPACPCTTQPTTPAHPVCLCHLVPCAAHTQRRPGHTPSTHTWCTCACACLPCLCPQPTTPAPLAGCHTHTHTHICPAGGAPTPLYPGAGAGHGHHPPPNRCPARSHGRPTLASCSPGVGSPLLLLRQPFQSDWLPGRRRSATSKASLLLMSYSMAACMRTV